MGQAVCSHYPIKQSRRAALPRREAPGRRPRSRRGQVLLAAHGRSPGHPAQAGGSAGAEARREHDVEHRGGRVAGDGRVESAATGLSLYAGGGVSGGGLAG